MTIGTAWGGFLLAINTFNLKFKSLFAFYRIRITLFLIVVIIQPGIWNVTPPCANWTNIKYDQTSMNSTLCLLSSYAEMSRGALWFRHNSEEVEGEEVEAGWPQPRTPPSSSASAPRLEGSAPASPAALGQERRWRSRQVGQWSEWIAPGLIILL